MLPKNLDGVEWNVRKVLSPVLVLTCICGLSSPSKKAFRIFGLVYQLFMFGVCILVFIHEIPNIIFSQTYSVNLHALMLTIKTKSSWVSFFLNFLFTAFKSRKINFLLDSINREFVLPQAVQAKIFKFNLAHILLNIASLILYNILGLDFAWENLYHMPYTSLLYVFTDFVTLLCALEFIEIVNLISEMFKNINSRLEVYMNQIRPGSEVFLDEKEIMKLRKLHLFLTRTCAEVNSCFSTQILLVIFVSMIKILYALRSLAGDFSILDMDKMMLNIATDTFWLLPYSALLLQLITFCEKTSSEGRKSIILVHHLMNLFYFDKKSVKELQLFAMQIQQHPVVFNVKFFDLNYPFLNSFISSLTTYFIIIVTFHGEINHGSLIHWDLQIPTTTESPTAS